MGGTASFFMEFSHYAFQTHRVGAYWNVAAVRCRKNSFG
jgi:hypothetical protein